MNDEQRPWIGHDERGPYIDISLDGNTRVRLDPAQLRELCHAWLASCDYAEQLDEEEKIGESGMEPDDVRF